MKKGRSSWLVAAVVLVTLVGCRLPWGGGGPESPKSPPVIGGTGTLVLSLAPTSVLVARTITPPESMEIHHYTIRGSGPGDPFLYEDYTEDTLIQASLEPGVWTIEVEAYTATGILIGEGAQDFTVTAGQAVTVELAVSPLDGEGELEILVTWPEGVLADPAVLAQLTPVGGDPGAMDFAMSSTSAHYYWDAIPRGYYAVSLCLEDAGEPVWGTVEAARIMAGVKSYRHYDLVEDVNRGGIVITPDLQDPIEVVIEGVIDPLEPGESMTVTAATYGEIVDSYQWFLNGDPTGGDSASLTVGGLEPGHYWLDVLVTSGPVMSSANAEFDVTGAGVEPFDLTGLWDLYHSEDGEMMGPEPFWLAQDGTDLDGTWGFYGSVTGTTVDLFMTGEDEDTGEISTFHLTGIYSGGSVVGTYTMDGMPAGDWRIEPPDMSQYDFGTLSLEGMVNGIDVTLSTDYAEGEREVRRDLGFGASGSPFGDGGLGFTLRNTEFTARTYEVGEYDEEESPDVMEVWAGHGWYEAEWGTVTFLTMDANGYSGSLDLHFEEGDISGPFNISFSGCGSIDFSGSWFGQSFMWADTCPWGWPQGEQHKVGISMWDHEKDVRIRIEGSESLAPGVYDLGPDYSMPNTRTLGLSYYLDEGGGFSDHEDDVFSQSGTLTIHSYTGDHIVGEFTATFPGGTATGEFDVPVELGNP